MATAIACAGFRRPFTVMTVLFAAITGTVPGWQPPPQDSSGPQSAPTDIGTTSRFVMGDVIAIESGGQSLTLRTNQGDVRVQLGEQTQYLSLSPGETTLETAEEIVLADISIGDRVLARGTVEPDRKLVLARQLIVMSGSAIAMKREREREEWRRRSIAGTVTAIESTMKEISVRLRSSEGPPSIMVTTGDHVVFRRYSPDSVRFADARLSSFAQLEVGDQLRALGERSADGARFQAEQIVSGSFTMAGGPITTIDVSAGEIRINDIPTGQPTTFVIKKDSMLRRLSPEVAARLAQLSQGGDTRSIPSQTRGSQPGRSSRPGGRNGRGREVPGNIGDDPNGPGEGNILELIENLPAISLADLKPGEMILVSAAKGTDSTRLTAIVVAAGVEALLTPPRQSRQAGPANLGLGLPGNILDLIVGPLGE